MTTAAEDVAQTSLVEKLNNDSVQSSLARALSGGSGTVLKIGMAIVPRLLGLKDDEAKMVRRFVAKVAFVYDLDALGLLALITQIAADFDVGSYLKPQLETEDQKTRLNEKLEALKLETKGGIFQMFADTFWTTDEEYQKQLLRPLQLEYQAVRIVLEPSRQTVKNNFGIYFTFIVTLCIVFYNYGSLHSALHNVLES